MNISLNKLKNSKVFICGTEEPWGIVQDICFNGVSGRVDAIIAASFSLIPISSIITTDEINYITSKGIFLKKNCIPRRLGSLVGEKHTCRTKQIDHVRLNEKKCGRLRDLGFDLESGEITDIVVSKNKITKKKKIPINKIHVKDNTIYIE